MRPTIKFQGTFFKPTEHFLGRLTKSGINLLFSDFEHSSQFIAPF